VRFAVLGAGATGGYLGACLARAGLDVTLIARGRHLEAMRENGLTVLEPDGTSFTVRPACTDRLEAAGEADATFVTLKAHGLPAVAPALGACLRPETALVFAQNGVPWWFALAGAGGPLESVDPGGVIAASIPARHVIGCVVYPATSLEAPGVVRHVEGNRLPLADLDGSRSERVAAIASALAGAGLRAPVQTRMREEIWLKLLGNATLNPVGALTRATLGQMLGDPGTRALIRALMVEVQAVGRALGIEPPIGIDRRLEGSARIGDHRPSMLQDVDAGRPLEVEALVGSVVELGHRMDVPVPALEVVYQLTRQLDRSLRPS
jgi:2-dehydropantoate 2-reductase